MECRGFESHSRQLIFLRKSDCLGCAVLLCLVCLFDLACFFLPSFSSLIQTCTCIYMYKYMQVAYDTAVEPDEEEIGCASVHGHIGIVIAII